MCRFRQSDFHNFPQCLFHEFIFVTFHNVNSILVFSLVTFHNVNLICKCVLSFHGIPRLFKSQIFNKILGEINSKVFEGMLTKCVSLAKVPLDCVLPPASQSLNNRTLGIAIISISSDMAIYHARPESNCFAMLLGRI